MRSPLHPLVATVLGTVAGLTAIPAAPAGAVGVDDARVRQLAAMLPEAPRGVGPTIEDREAWGAVARSPAFKDVVPRAEKLMAKPIPELTDELYLDFSRTGNRGRYQRVLWARHSRMPQFVLAECIENRGRFLPAIETAIRAISSEKTWTYPAHDRDLRNFSGRVRDIDLAVANESWNLATADYWLADKLSGEVRKLIRDQLEQRTFGPFEASVKTGKPRHWWLTHTNNWTAVCLAGVNGAALAVIDSPQRRAFYVAAAEKYVQNFLRGFPADGYCTEGVGYWNYGFGHYVMLAETIHQATGGKLDLLAGPRIEQIARFGTRMDILPGIYPAFADCSPGAQPDGQLMAFLSRRYGFGLKEVEQRGLLLAAGPSTRLFGLGLFGFANSATAVPAAEGPPPPKPLRDWFPDAGVLVCRPAPGAKPGFGAALKGGHNDEHHNHNDVGSYLIALGRQTPLVDPGAEVYTARTFSSKRYVSNVINSFGHPVPRVAGRLQRTGRSAAGKVLNTEFTDRADTLVLDISAAYDVKPLKKLVRTFVFSRQDRGGLTVIDEVELDGPQSFGTALITFSKWKRLSPNRLLVGEGAAAVQVEISAEGGAFEIQSEQIKEDLHGGRLPVRIGIELKQPVTEAKITIRITPAA